MTRRDKDNALAAPTKRLHALVFDSGVGGLSIAKEIAKRRPDVAQSYLADDAFRPYGEKSEAQLRARLPHLLAPIVDMLRPDILVVACNTASTAALPDIRAVLDIPVVGTVPAIKPAAQQSRTKTIAVLGTPGTVARSYVDDLIDRFADGCHVILRGSVNLVDAAEAKLDGRTVDLAAIRAEIAPIFDGRPGADVDAVVLACTHFPLLVDELKSAARQSVAWIDSGEAVARRVDSLLKKTSPKGYPPVQGTAFLIGGTASDLRRRAFSDFGFDRIVSLPE